MKKTCIAVSLLLAGCFVFQLTGCQGSSWHLAASKLGDSVQLCLSNDVQCPQPGGVSPSGISIYRYDSTYDNALIWDAQPDNPITHGTISGVVTYGIPPEHWSSKLAPPALICGKAYLVNPGATFFALKCDGSVVVFDFQHLDEFFRQQQPSAPEKKRPGH